MRLCIMIFQLRTEGNAEEEETGPWVHGIANGMEINASSSYGSRKDLMEMINGNEK